MRPHIQLLEKRGVASNNSGGVCTQYTGRPSEMLVSLKHLLMPTSAFIKPPPTKRKKRLRVASREVDQATSPIKTTSNSLQIGSNIGNLIHSDRHLGHSIKDHNIFGTKKKVDVARTPVANVGHSVISAEAFLGLTHQRLTQAIRGHAPHPELEERRATFPLCLASPLKYTTVKALMARKREKHKRPYVEKSRGQRLKPLRRRLDRLE
ncbi:hypothetical protein BHE74_00058435 [Ensete ventricosum]|nr:hypothetical protein BHE74_00058435 [Ensete ventricosum]